MSQKSVPPPADSLSQSERLLLDTLSTLAHTQARATHAMPGAFYTSERFTELERERIFRRSWACIGHVGEVPANGDYFTTELVGEPLLVQRDAQGALRVFANVCRHRGNQVATGRGNARVHVCGYHAWSYDLNGKLKRAPLMQDCNELDATRCALPEIPTAIWQNFIFVNLDATAAPFGDKLAPLESYIRDYRNGERERYYSKEEVWATNWKCLAENFLEGYHLNATHPQTIRPRSPSENSEYVPGNGHFCAYRLHYKAGSTQATPGDLKVANREGQFSFVFNLFPNLIVSCNSHQTVYMCLRPLSSDRVALRYGVTGPAAMPDPESLATYVQRFDKINAEDREKLETLQISLRSSFYTPGPLAPDNYEGTLRDLYSYIARRICA